MRAALIVLAGCALTTKATPVEVRYFSPVTAEQPAAQPARVSGRVRLGRVTASSYLRSRIAHRRSALEVELSDSMRWTEDPEQYVRRAVAQALFVDRGVPRAVSGESLTLAIEITGFEHVERGGRHFGRVQLRFELDDDRDVVAEDVVTIEHESPGGDIALIVAAIGASLDGASAEVAGRIVTHLRSAP